MIDMWKVFGWGYNVSRKARRLAATTCRLVSKWKMCQVVAAGLLLALGYMLLAGPPRARRPSEGPYDYPRLAYEQRPYTRRFDDLDEVIGMMSQRQVELQEGYHKRAYVYVGELVVLSTFDTGSFRNAIQLELLKELEAKQKAGQLGRRVVSPRAKCAQMNVLGATTAMTGSYDEVVEIEITFRGSDGHSATALITFVIMRELSSPMILGCPTLDRLMFAMTSNAVELRAYDLELPTVLPESQCSAENVASLSESVTIHPEEMCELWVPTKADPSKQWMIKGAA